MNKRRILVAVLIFAFLIASVFPIMAQENLSQTEIDNQTIANKLNKLGMLSGDSKGNYNLNSKLLRAEGSTFIVNLLGMSDFVKQNKSTMGLTGFQDVKETDWYAAYIGFCSQNKILEGYIVDDKSVFGPTQYLTEKQFLAMLLRALGYTEVVWDDIFKTAFQVGLVKDKSYESKTLDNLEFTRADTIRLMYYALLINKKDSNIPLIKQLVKEGKITQTKAVEAGILNDELVTSVSSVIVQGDEWIEILLNEAIQPIQDTNINIFDSQTKEILGFKIYSQSESKIRLKTSKQGANREYTVELRNVLDQEGNTVNKVSSRFIGYDNKAIVSDFFKISKVEQVSNNELMVYFTQPINENAENADNIDIFLGTDLFIDGNNTTLLVSKKTSTNNALKITLKNQSFSSDTEYTIKISGSMISSYGTYLGQESGDERSFVTQNIHNDKFGLVGIKSITNKIVQLDFNHSLDYTAEQVFNYYITEGYTNIPFPITMASILNDKSVILVLGNEMDNKVPYNLLINIAYDEGKVNKIENQKYSYSSTTNKLSDMQIISIKHTDYNCVTATFDRPIQEAASTNVNNYSLLCINDTMYDEIPVKAVYSKQEPNNIKLYFSYNKPLIADNAYKLKVKASFRDVYGVMLSKEIDYTFIANKTVKTEPKIVDAVYIAKDTIKINFNKDISMDSPNIITQNYYVESGVRDSVRKVPIGITYIDSNTIVFRFDKIDTSGQNYIMYKEIKDITGETYTGGQAGILIRQGN